MQKVISKYGLAAHLASMAVAPLFLLPFVSASATATAMLWLAAFGCIWLLMEPSRRRGEMLHDARVRVCGDIVRDPVFWLSLVMAGYAAVRVLNSGIGLAYDAELMSWSIQEPAFPLLPGSVTGTGYLPFATAVSLVVILQGTRHALGQQARVAFLLVASVLSSIASIVLAFAISYGHAGVLAMTKFTLLSASYFGPVFGILLLCGLAALFLVIAHQWVKAEPLAVLGIIGNGIGLVTFASTIQIAIFLIAFFVFVVASFVLFRHVFEGSGSLRCALAVLITVGGAVLYALSAGDTIGMPDKIAAFQSVQLFPENYATLRDTLSAIAFKTWKANPWLGTGLGSFPLDIRFGATAEDWQVVLPMQQTCINGWWQLLVERGVIGTALMAATLGIFLWTYVTRFIGSFRAVRFSPEHLVTPVLLLVLIALAFFDCSFLRPEILLLAGTFLSFSGGAFPRRVKHSDED